MSKSRSNPRTLIITDDEEEVVKEEMNPFSFKQFLRSQNLEQSEPELDLDSEDQDPDQDQERDWGHSWTSGCETSAGSFCTEEEEEVTRFDSRPDVSRQSYEEDDEMSILESESRTRPGLQQLKQENEELRRTITELRDVSLKNQLRAEELSAELLQRQRRDQQEALDLETMVQSVEHNLKLMTKRAVKAEASVSKLKTELKQLQVRLEEVSAENAALKASESELVLTMRQNAQTASDRLQQTANHAHSSVRRLLSEAESLRFVSELLQSIDRMSTIH